MYNFYFCFFSLYVKVAFSLRNGCRSFFMCVKLDEDKVCLREVYIPIYLK